MDQIIEYIITGSAFVLTLSSVALSIFLKKTTKKQIENLTIDYGAIEDPNKESRLTDIRVELEMQEVLAKWNSKADGLLIFGQYIIGGVLASSFIQQSLSANFIGLLGVLVLFSSLVRQKFRSDIKAEAAKAKVKLLKQLIREIEDDLYALKTNHETAISMFDIRKKVTTKLSDIENTGSVNLENNTPSVNNV